jgi:hypothetical protein
MCMLQRLLIVLVSGQTMTVLEILARKTNRTNDEIVQEALNLLFEEYKEVILDTLEKKDFRYYFYLERVPRIDISLESYKGKKPVTNITDLELTQINSARMVIIQDNSHYSETLKNGGYLFDDLSKWQIFDVEKSELGITRVVLWNERDDGSFSVHFTENSTEATFYCFEN